MFAAYKKALDKTIDAETDGDLGKLLLEILKVSIHAIQYFIFVVFLCVRQYVRPSAFDQNPGKKKKNDLGRNVFAFKLK